MKRQLWQLFKFLQIFFFELLASNTIKNETKEKFKNLLGINLVKYSSKFLAHRKNLVIQSHQEMFKIIAQENLVSVLTW